VTWRRKKQNIVARFSGETEFQAMAQCVSELCWLRIILNDLKVTCEESMILYCDNNQLLALLVQHGSTKHIVIDQHF